MNNVPLTVYRDTGRGEIFAQGFAPWKVSSAAVEELLESGMLERSDGEGGPDRGKFGSGEKYRLKPEHAKRLMAEWRSVQRSKQTFAAKPTPKPRRPADGELSDEDLDALIDEALGGSAKTAASGGDEARVYWDEAEHPREEAGTPEGGQFAPAGGAGDGAGVMPVEEVPTARVIPKKVDTGRPNSKEWSITVDDHVVAKVEGEHDFVKAKESDRLRTKMAWRYRVMCDAKWLATVLGKEVTTGGFSRWKGTQPEFTHESGLHNSTDAFAIVRESLAKHAAKVGLKRKFLIREDAGIKTFAAQPQPKVEQAVRQAHPDWTDEQVVAEVERLLAEGVGGGEGAEAGELSDDELDALIDEVLGGEGGDPNAVREGEGADAGAAEDAEEEGAVVEGPAGKLEPTDEEVAAGIMAEHPDWDEAQVKAAVVEWRAARKKPPQEKEMEE